MRRCGGRWQACGCCAPLLPGKILGVGRNYADHAKEVGGPKLDRPPHLPEADLQRLRPGQHRAHPRRSVTKPDWEVELAVVIGRTAWQVSEGTALDHVAGYTVLNDVSARELQFDQPLA